jgi:hypothetical protein
MTHQRLIVAELDDMRLGLAMLLPAAMLSFSPTGAPRHRHCLSR